MFLHVPESQSSLPPQRLTARLIFIDLQKRWMSVCVCVGDVWALIEPGIPHTSPLAIEHDRST